MKLALHWRCRIPGLSKLNRTKQHKVIQAWHDFLCWEWGWYETVTLILHNTGCWIIYRWTYFEDNPQVSSANWHTQLHINTTHTIDNRVTSLLSMLTHMYTPRTHTATTTTHPHPIGQHSNTYTVHTSMHTVHTYTSTHTMVIQMLGARIRRSSC